MIESPSHKHYQAKTETIGFSTVMKEMCAVQKEDVLILDNLPFGVFSLRWIFEMSEDNYSSYSRALDLVSGKINYLESEIERLTQENNKLKRVLTEIVEVGTYVDMVRHSGDTACDYTTVSTEAKIASAALKGWLDNSNSEL